MIRQNCFTCQTSPLWSMSDCDDDLFSFCLLKSILYRLRTHHLYMLNVVMILLIPINSYYCYTYYRDDSIPMKKRIKRPARFSMFKKRQSCRGSSSLVPTDQRHNSWQLPRRTIISWVALAGDQQNAYESLCIIYFSISFQPLLQYYRPQTFGVPPLNLKSGT